ncbi:MAG: helix-turn-helix domain-containing protein [Gordonia sp. (in: high G+C Gram-positive bacteria)]
MTQQAARAKRGPYASGTARRAEILDAALALFGEVGYHGASLREIADRAGISHTGLLRHFPNKSALLGATLAERERRIRSEFRLDEDRDPIDLLRDHIRVMERNAALPGIIELYAVLSTEAAAPSHPAHDYFVTRFRAIRAHLTNTFTQLAAAGLLRPGLEPADAAIAVISHADGLQVQWLLEPQAVDLGRVTRRFVQDLVTVPL